MEFKYPVLLYVGIPAVCGLFVLFFFLKKKGRSGYFGGRKAANTSYARALPEFTRLKVRYLVLRILVAASLLTSAISTVVLAARPYETRTQETGVKKRDIFLCLDVSYSIYELNQDLVDELEDVVRGLDGDRFGISLYNTTSVLYVPMTDDYDFVIQKMEELKEYFRDQKTYVEKYGDYQYISEMSESEQDEFYELFGRLDVIDQAVTLGNERKGSSLVGEGLASCMYNFPKLDSSNRTRVVIMSTDNMENSFLNPVVDLDGAADLCKKYGVTVFGVFPDLDSYNLNIDDGYSISPEEARQDFEKAVDKTGGKFYIAGNSFPVADVVQDIQKQKAMTVKKIFTTRTVDMPEVPLAVLLISLAIAAAAERMLKE
ncbi:MAG: hypothetical protein U0L49_06495 [Eubacterium sp.]|nr:hypothetical protein [Eubacterium sp.]